MNMFVYLYRRLLKRCFVCGGRAPEKYELALHRICSRCYTIWQNTNVTTPEELAREVNRK